jgi:hypothetical protein
MTCCQVALVTGGSRGIVAASAVVVIRTRAEISSISCLPRCRAPMADGLASLLTTARPEGSRSILEWFHISMRLRSIEQMAPKVAGVLKEQDPHAAALTLQKVPRIRYQMWNGRCLQAVKRMHTIYDAAKQSLETVTTGDRERLHRFRQHLFDLHEYLKNNWTSLTNYAYACRHGLRISSAPAESRFVPGPDTG